MDRHPLKGKTGLIRVFNAFHYSMEGLRAAYQNEDAFRQEVLMAVIMIPLAFVLSQDPIRLSLMIGSVLLVIIVELLNSAIEAVVDRISYEHHELAKRAKDIGSAAVLISLLGMTSTWIMCLI